MSWRDLPAVLGTVDATLVIEHISRDAELLFGVPISTLIGNSMIDLVADADADRCRAGVAEAAVLGRGITLNLGLRAIRTAGNQPVEPARCETLILPFHPPPSCAFVFLPTSLAPAGISVSTELSTLLGRLGA